jgi:hypothetical protein
MHPIKETVTDPIALRRAMDALDQKKKQKPERFVVLGFGFTQPPTAQAA